MHILELHLLTNDLPGTRRFYHEVLELTLTNESHDFIALKLPRSLLYFHAVKDQNPQYHIALTIPSNKASQSLEWIRGKAELIPVGDNEYIADFRNWNAESVYFYDNNRSIMEFIGRRDLQNATDLPFGSSGILAISEVGLVTGDVIQTCEELKIKYGLGYFTRQQPGKNFAASGDDEGLFIVVTEGRPWYPTDIPSLPHWLKITFFEGGKEHVLENGIR